MHLRRRYLTVQSFDRAGAHNPIRLRLNVPYKYRFHTQRSPAFVVQTFTTIHEALEPSMDIFVSLTESFR